MSHLILAKTAANLRDAKSRVSELEGELASFKKKAAAEDLLLKIMQDPNVPLHLKPSSIADFVEKRAHLEALEDIAVAEAAVKMASSQGFEIGAPEDPTPLYQSSGSPADDMFTDWLLNSQS